MSKTQAPDTQGNSKDGLGGAFPTGSSSAGMSGNVNPDDASLSTGYAKVSIAGGMSGTREGDELGYAPTQSGGGFAGRAGGWER
jgi:hypothetical protein